MPWPYFHAQPLLWPPYFSPKMPGQPKKENLLTKHSLSSLIQINTSPILIMQSASDQVDQAFCRLRYKKITLVFIGFA